MIKYILAFDPGGTTGWVLGYYSDSLPFQPLLGGQIPDGVAGFSSWWSEPEDEIRFLYEVMPPEKFTVVSESFQLRASVKNPDVTPLRIEGALTALLGDGVVHYQQPSKKALVTDSKLREIGFWVAGQRHQMDARIHALAYLKSQGHMPTIQAYWPEFGEEE